MSEDGCFGLSVIAFVGSVFSPYYKWVGYRDPENHVSINVALYGRGVRRWTMTERTKSALFRSPDVFQVGPSFLRRDGDAFELSLDEIAVPIPRRVRGTVRLQPSTLNTQRFAIDGAARHRWGPIAPLARVEAHFDHPDLHFSGHGYFDSNEGDEPLARGFRAWDWSRAETSDGCVTLYDTVLLDGSRRSLANRFRLNGTVETLEPPPRVTLPRGPLWRVARGTQSHGTARVAQTLEDTPFYTRSVLQTDLYGERVTAMHESLDALRFDTPFVRAMLPWRMPRRIL